MLSTFESEVTTALQSIWSRSGHEIQHFSFLQPIRIHRAQHWCRILTDLELRPSERSICELSEMFSAPAASQGCKWKLWLTDSAATRAVTCRLYSLQQVTEGQARASSGFCVPSKYKVLILGWCGTAKVKKRRLSLPLSSPPFFVPFLCAVISDILQKCEAEFLLRDLGILLRHRGYQDHTAAVHLGAGQILHCSLNPVVQ